MILNDGQERIRRAAISNIRNGYKQVFEFGGEAGTGKSVVLNSIINTCGIPRERIACMAYTGQAAIVMRTKGMPDAKTIHSSLYHAVEQNIVDSNGMIVMDTYLNRPKVKLCFEPKPLYDIDLFIIDEGYTVPRSMKYEIESRGKPIVVAGDWRQLKPVNDEPAYLYDEANIMQLTDPMRQEANSAKLYIAKRALAGLPIQTGFYSNDCLVIDEDDLRPEFLINSDIVICAKNETRDRFNRHIRQDLLGRRTDLPMLGEKVICRKNNWNLELGGINLANGLIGEVTNLPDVGGFDGKTFKLDFKPYMLNSSFKNLLCNYKYLTSPYKLKDSIKNDKYSRGEMFEYAYASTCHLMQGAAFNNVLYFEEYIGHGIQNSLNYVAATRARNRLIYVKKKKKFY